MKVVHLAPHFDNSGNGVVNVAIDLACMQARSGIEVVFIGDNGSFAELLRCEGVTVHSIPLRSARSFFSTFQELRRVLKKFDPDIVHAHLIPGALFGFSLQPGLRFKLVTTIHNSRRFGAQLMSLGDIVICVSNYLSGEMLRRGIPSKKLKVVLNGPLGSPRLPTNPERIDLKNPAIITVAELASFKGVGDLISAFSLIDDKLPLPYLYILGDGPERSRLERRARQSNCADRIIFCGSIPDPTPYLLSSDIFVLASHREGFGLALAEARNAGCAVVATNVGGIPEVLEGGAAGILVPAQSPARLALILNQLLGDHVSRSHWSAKAKCNLDWLSCQRCAAETLNVYEQVLGYQRTK